MSEFTVGACIILGLVLAIFGAGLSFTPEYSYPEEHFRAQEICIKNDGVEKMEYDFLYIDVRCMDGAEFVIERGPL